MKYLTGSAILSIAALSSTALAAVTMNIARSSGPRLKPRALSKRASITESLINNNTGGDYIAQVSVGTPPQNINLAIDTGSSDVWMISSTADLCTERALQAYDMDGCDTPFDSSKSSTFKVVGKGEFNIQYEDNSGATGDYVTDTFSIGGASIKTLEMGLAYNVTLDSGLMGIGYDANEASTDPEAETVPFEYPSIIDSMVSQGLIPSKAYSLYLNDLEASTGSIIFGGLDSDKYHGNLVQMPIIPSTLQNGSTMYYDFAVALTGFSITGQAGNVTQFTTSSFEEAAILDSGTTITYLPDRLAEEIISVLNGYIDNEGNVYVDCNLLTQSPKTTFNYEFGGPKGVNISVPISEVVFPLTGIFSTDGFATPDVPFASPCALGISGTGGQAPTTLGDTFLRSAYVVYDLSNNLIAIAQTNFNSTTSSIVEFQASATSIPNVSGVASSVTGVTETATGPQGVGGKTTATTGSSATTTEGVTTTTNGAGTTTTKSSTTTGSASTSATTSTTKSGAVGSVPAFDIRGLMILGISSIFALLGGSWLLA